MGLLRAILFGISAVWMGTLAAATPSDYIFTRCESVQINYRAIAAEENAQQCLDRAEKLVKRGKNRDAIRIYRRIGRRFASTKSAPIAQQKLGEIYVKQHRFHRAFEAFRKIIEEYPDYEGYKDIIALEFEMAERLMNGQRNYFFGKIPGFKNREGAIQFFQAIIGQAPYSEYVPMALMHTATLSQRAGNSVTAIEALERVIDEYAETEYGPRALLALAQIYRNMVCGADYDQRATEDAINYFREFLILYADSPLVPEVQKCLEEAKTLLAIGKLRMGNFYYDDRQNGEAAIPYYEAAIATAPNSKAAEIAELRMREVNAGKNGRGSPLDFLLGPYKAVH
ncbi:MAG: tetratricopeptide repeat protein [Puniceicoccales bacterium]|jgi:outer membrane protein assembly factor BamD|nr:tetratricopeptide repeat protein [Puniceicoccales bacterium]